jgi:hypothetical protein
MTLAKQGLGTEQKLDRSRFIEQSEADGRIKMRVVNTYTGSEERLNLKYLTQLRYWHNTLKRGTYCQDFPGQHRFSMLKRREAK